MTTRSPYRTLANLESADDANEQAAATKRLRHMLVENIFLGALLALPCAFGIISSHFQAIETLCGLGLAIVVRDSWRCVGALKRSAE